MKLKIKEAIGWTGLYDVFEDGKDTKKVKYEKIGILVMIDNRKDLILSDDYSGILRLDEMQQIIDFANSLTSEGDKQ